MALYKDRICRSLWGITDRFVVRLQAATVEYNNKWRVDMKTIKKSKKQVKRRQALFSNKASPGQALSLNAKLHIVKLGINFRT